jgi:rare lipoprotein A
MQLKIISLLVFIFFISSISSKSQSDSIITYSKSKKSKTFIGTASFYATKFEGKKTANGEIFRHNKYTAACNKIPLGTMVRVTNLTNNKSVEVKINDRLHAKNHRLIDLTSFCAKELGFYFKGLAKVKVEVLD